MAKHKYPEFLLRNSKVRTSREWETLHRKRLRRAYQAVDSAKFGCAHSPAFAEIVAASNKLEAALQLCAYNTWTRPNSGDKDE